MQAALTSHYELAWQVADLVATHGAYDFGTGDRGLRQMVKFCGLTVEFEHGMPVRIEGPEFDVTLHARAGVQPFETTFYGDAYREAHALLGAEYTVVFVHGGVNDLRARHNELSRFVAATAPRKAAA